MKYTVLGSSGFIGSHLVRWLESQGHECFAPKRGEDLSGRPLGHVIYSIGLTADWRERQHDTVKAHVCALLEVLEKTDFKSLLYLSTTRLYAGVEDTHEEGNLRVNPLRTDDLYNISKIMGESICLSSPRENIRIARLSNVFGDDFTSENFLTSVLRDAAERNQVILRTSLDSAKDYVSGDDVVQLLPRIASEGQRRVYNVASGENTTHRALVDAIVKVTGCRIEVAEGSPTVSFPPILIERIREEFGFSPVRVVDALPGLVEEYKRRFLQA